MLRKFLTLCAVLVALPSVALADEAVGAPGLVTQLEVNATSADLYLAYHGRVVVKGSVGTEYRWGGVSCGSRTLSDAHVALLQRALDSGLTVFPRYQPGQGEVLCLVGFRMR